ncbi:TPA_exp: Uncharacterized protein A8136_1639 [Trichophyton benhamiae CBS 112371]|uniref:Myb-like domain-containing protein n=1 Tax=Arthroderma benhamiae (strain ATCC MYA-4681 / CBS 112371) TaxID=663331 RepID=D4AWU0_ARTBC|nr:uncharacterized protein ARB_00656 [Trichophyton benhamiae CBS 112371]EFE32471.1 conserved hypothetical protein [Trichophyton benhamiae CBS 112371]DAA75565.1 TPA_exp: Uncharacterized protein A8136_1639 [Trichophyton benhamiae CBS 112371]
MPEFTPLNEVETEPFDVKMEDASEGEVSEDKKSTPASEMSEEAPEPTDADDVKAEDDEGEAPKAQVANTKAAKGRGTNGKKATNGAIKTEEEAKIPVTPRKRGRKAKAGDATGAATAEEADDEAETPSKKKRATPAKGTPSKAGKRALPSNFDEASEEDKMLLRMKDEENKPWSEIKTAWEKATGETVGGSTLSNRYQRIKANFTVFSPEDEAKLIQYKKDIEDKFENEKWCRIADAMEAAGGKRYPAAALQKKFKDLGRKMAAKEADGIDE